MSSKLIADIDSIIAAWPDLRSALAKVGVQQDFGKLDKIVSDLAQINRDLPFSEETASTIGELVSGLIDIIQPYYYEIIPRGSPEGPSVAQQDAHGKNLAMMNLAIATRNLLLSEAASG